MKKVTYTLYPWCVMWLWIGRGPPDICHKYSNKLSPVHGRDAREAWCSVTIGLCDKPTPGKILPIIQFNPLVGLCPWNIYLPREVSTPLLKKNQAPLFFHIHEYWILLKLFGWYKSDFHADHICCPIHMHIWKRVNMQVRVIHVSCLKYMYHP